MNETHGRSHTIAIIVLLALVAIVAVLYVRISLATPFAEGQDAFAHMKYATNILETGRIDFTFNTSNVQPPLYQYFPLLHIELAAWASVLGVNIAVAATILNVLTVVLTPLILFTVASRLFRSDWVGLFAATLSLFPGIYPAASDLGLFRFFSPHYFSLLLFFATVAFFVFPGGRRLSVAPSVGFAAVASAVVLFHPQSGIGRWLTLLVITLLLAFIERPPEKQRALLFLGGLIIPAGIFVALHWHTIPYFLSVGETFRVDPITVMSTLAPNENIYTLIGNSGIATFIFSLIGFLALYVFRVGENSRTAKVILAATIAVSLALTFQHLIKFNFFPGRFKNELIFPTTLLAAYGLAIVIWRLRVKALVASVIFCLLILPTVAYLSRISLNVGWNDIQAVEWVQKNLKGATILADPYTFYTFNALAIIRPAYQFSSGRFTELLTDRSIAAVFGGDAATAYAYARSNDIDYIIVDFTRNPQRISGDYEKFSDRSYFLPVFDSSTDREKQIIIYTLAPTPPKSPSPA